MKKILCLLSFMLFTVAMFASPPPDAVPGYLADEVQFVAVLDNVSITVQTIAVSNFAFVYIGYAFTSTGTATEFEPVKRVTLPDLLVQKNSFMKLSELNKPPSLIANAGVSNNRSKFQRNKQNTNFGYPFTAN